MDGGHELAVRIKGDFPHAGEGGFQMRLQYAQLRARNHERALGGITERTELLRRLVAGPPHAGRLENRVIAEDSAGGQERYRGLVLQ